MERAVSEILSWEREGVPSQRVEGQTLVIGVVPSVGGARVLQLLLALGEAGL